MGNGGVQGFCLLLTIVTGSGDYESAVTGEEFAVPKDIGDMELLEEFSLQNNYLKGELPESIGRCKKLAVLRLENNKISGKIPPSLGNCAELRVFFALDNELIGTQAVVASLATSAH